MPRHPYPLREPGIHATAVIGEGVTLGKDVYIGPYTVIEDGATIGDGTIIDGLVFIAQHVTIGRDCHLYPQVNIRESCVLGDRVILHAGVKIGTDGYGYTVEIGAKGPIDNLVQVGHNVQIAPFVGIIAQAGIAGSAKIESGALIWSQAGVSGHLTVHERAQVAPQAGVKEDVPEGEYVAGTPAIPKRKFAEGLLLPRLVDKLKKKVADLEAKVKALETK